MILNLVALSFEGSVMCTVETRMAEEGIGGFVTLKFWERGSQNNDFSLSTVIYEPHRFVSSLYLLLTSFSFFR